MLFVRWHRGATSFGLQHDVRLPDQLAQATRTGDRRAWRRVFRRHGSGLAVQCDIEAGGKLLNQKLLGQVEVVVHRIECAGARAEPVSYTHLTLPTSDLV